MGTGISKGFRIRFPAMAELWCHNGHVGDVVLVVNCERFSFKSDN